MAEFMGQKKPAKFKSGADEGFNSLGKPVSFERMKLGDDALKDMGLDNAEERIACVRAVASRLERDALPNSSAKAATIHG